MMLAPLATTAQTYGDISGSRASVGLNYPMGADEAPAVKIRSLEELSSQRLNDDDPSLEEVPEARRKALQSIATMVGEQHGRAYTMEQKRREIDKLAPTLDQMYNFGSPDVLCGPLVLCPVVLSGNNNLSQVNGSTRVYSHGKFQVIREAKMVSVLPTFRDYLLLDAPPSPRLPRSATAQNDAEAKIWDSAVKQGWDRGVQMADQSVEIALSTMQRDYEGMKTFKALVLQNVITAPELATANLGVTLENGILTVNKHIQRIVTPSEFVANPAKWRTPYPVTGIQQGVAR